MHTPGPWHIRKGPDRYIVADPEKVDGGISWVTVARAYPDAKEQDANARLIAAAPELLAACEAALRYLDYTDPMGVESQEEQDLLDAAIRKARGE